MFLHENKKLFFEIIHLAADDIGIPTTIVEKDYYVTMILKEIASKAEKAVFKGGTSLSKCFHIINRFSEDIDISFSEHIGSRKRKRLKYEVIGVSADELKLKISNWKETQSDRDLNNYIFCFNPLTEFKNQVIAPEIRLETSLMLKAFPIEEKEIGSYIFDFLINNHSDIIDKYSLSPFSMKVQSITRTFIDKVYALCDYYLQGKNKRYSRHLYDIYKIFPFMDFNSDFINLVNEIRNQRANLSSCPSAKTSINVSKLIEEFCTSNFFASDYMNTIQYFLSDEVKYESTVSLMMDIAKLGIF